MQGKLFLLKILNDFNDFLSSLILSSIPICLGKGWTHAQCQDVTICEKKIFPYQDFSLTFMVYVVMTIFTGRWTYLDGLTAIWPKSLPSEIE